MKKTYLPLSNSDVQLIRGKPVAKIITHPKNSRIFQQEEWVYLALRQNMEEHYFFKNGKLIGWEENALIH